jgi:hypothetical protein
VLRGWDLIDHRLRFARDLGGPRKPVSGPAPASKWRMRLWRAAPGALSEALPGEQASGQRERRQATAIAVAPPGLRGEQVPPAPPVNVS